LAPEWGVDRPTPGSGAVARVVLPVVLAGVVHSAVIGRDLLPGFKRPLDFGARLGGEPLLGANKTFRGLMVMPAASSVSAWALAFMGEPERYPRGFAFLARPGPAFRFGLLAGTGYALAELPNSFVKRRLHIPAGDHPRGIGKALSYVVDQVDSVAGIVLLTWAVYRPPRRVLTSIFITGSLAHTAIDMLLYLFGVKKYNGSSSPCSRGSPEMKIAAVQQEVERINR